MADGRLQTAERKWPAPGRAAHLSTLTGTQLLSICLLLLGRRQELLLGLPPPLLLALPRLAPEVKLAERQAALALAVLTPAPLALLALLLLLLLCAAARGPALCTALCCCGRLRAAVLAFLPAMLLLLRRADLLPAFSQGVFPPLLCLLHLVLLLLRLALLA
jgi:hypothetical protein